MFSPLQAQMRYPSAAGDYRSKHQNIHERAGQTDRFVFDATLAKAGANSAGRRVPASRLDDEPRAESPAKSRTLPPKPIVIPLGGSLRYSVGRMTSARQATLSNQSADDHET
jgi:hypothetical protein